MILRNPSFTYLIAQSAGTDEANRNMKKENRRKWNKRDYKIASTTMNKILDLFENNNTFVIPL